MTTCPKCDDISVVCITDVPFELGWHVRCKCGWAWANSGYFRSKKEAKLNWEKQMQLRYEYAKAEPKK